MRKTAVIKYGTVIIGVLSVCCAAGAADVTVPVSAASIDERYTRASTAYDNRDYTKAIDDYEELLRDGWRAPELYYNLANAYYRDGKRGRAILHYMNASYLKPRDQDIRHNLNYVIMESDAVVPVIAWPARMARSLSRIEWLRLAAVAWWLAMLCSAGICLSRRRRRTWGIAATLAAVCLLSALSGLFHWRRLRTHPAVVVTQPGQEALFAPLTGSTAHFAMPEGSIARVEDAVEGWYRISVGDKDGWMPRSALSPVNPWKRIKQGE